MIKAVFFDVDGTLFSHVTKQIPKSTEESLKRLKEKQVKCVVSTGRHMLELKDLHMTDFEFDGYITLNGQLCFDQKGKIIKGNPIEGSEKECILNIFKEKKMPLMLIEKDRMKLLITLPMILNAME